MQTTSPYLTAEQLKIQPWERDGLIALVGPLSRGELPGFDMMHWESCDTVRCIGGWVHHFAKQPRRWSWALARLYHPALGAYAWSDITQSQAARAVLSFLTTGDPRWADAVA